MSLTSARLVKENVGTGGKSTLAGLWFRYLPFSLVVNGLSPKVEMYAWLQYNIILLHDAIGHEHVVEAAMGMEWRPWEMST